MLYVYALVRIDVSERDYLSELEIQCKFLFLFPNKEFISFESKVHRSIVLDVETRER